MRKSSVVSVFIGVLMLWGSANSWADGNGPTARDVECNGCVNDTDIATSAVTESKLATGAVTDAKITGPISASKIEKPANVIIVAKSGGDFTSIQAALNSITPSATDPYVIKVMPGTYMELDITMKSYVHLQGQGRDVTRISFPTSWPHSIYLYSLTNVAISGFEIKDADTAIRNYDSSGMISNNMFTGNSRGILNETPTSTAKMVISGNIFSGNNEAIDNFNSSSTIISGNTITGNSGGNGGIYNVDSSPTITGNLITGNNLYGILNERSSPAISGNTITGNSTYGISNISFSSPNIMNNRITDNGGTGYTDIFVDATSAPNISFNIYDDITGTTGVGQFNVTSTGDLAPAP